MKRLLIIVVVALLLKNNFQPIGIAITVFHFWAYIWPNNKRIKMTPIERKMFIALKLAGYNPIPQYHVPPYRLDFAIIKNEIKLAVECDGKAYHSSPEQKAHDRKRTQYLNRRGWRVIRFSGRQINRELPKCIRRIKIKFVRLK